MPTATTPPTAAREPTRPDPEVRGLRPRRAGDRQPAHPGQGGHRPPVAGGRHPAGPALEEGVVEFGGAIPTWAVHEDVTPDQLEPVVAVRVVDTLGRVGPDHQLAAIGSG